MALNRLQVVTCGLGLRSAVRHPERKPGTLSKLC